MLSPLAIVLAAGRGTRMRSDLPKVLVPVAGRPMLQYVLDALQAAGVAQVALVVGYRHELLRDQFAQRPGVTFVLQPEQLGTGHAVACCREQIAAHRGPVLIVAGDSPMLQSSSVRALLARFESTRPACLLGTAHKLDPQGLGRIIRDPQGRFLRIVEEKDAAPHERQITEVNLSCYVFQPDDLLFALDRLSNRNAQREYYLTDCPEILLHSGRPVEAAPLLQPVETLSINTPEELAQVETVLRQQRTAGG
jgi:bifunctional UDP-N-acetylglucosamine pyrophosphorylase/glucosamine-1-phosphate N-acetyltransferase/UDP-N-acetylglucosamine pyrophosphorylase